MRCTRLLAFLALVACSDGGVRIGARPDAAGAPSPPDAPLDAFVTSDGPGFTVGLEVAPSTDTSWAAIGRGVVGTLLVQALGELAVREVLTGNEPSDLLQPRQRPCYLISRNDVSPGRPGVALDFTRATQRCLVTLGVLIAQAPLAARQPGQITFAAMPYLHGRRVDGALRAAATDDPMRFRVATGDPVLDPPVAFQDTCDGDSGTRCLRVCDAAGVCIRTGWTGLVTVGEGSPARSVALDGTGAVVGLVGAGLVDHVAEHSTSAGSSSIAPLSCEHDPPTWSPGPLRFETTDSGPACACAVSGTERLAGAMEYGVRKPCEAGTSLSFSLLGQDALARVVHGEACGSVSFAAVCAPGVLDVPRQTATGCVNECLALGCQWSSASGTCTCSGGSVPRGMRQAIFDLEPLLPAAFAAGERLGCAAPAP